MLKSLETLLTFCAVVAIVATAARAEAPIPARLEQSLMNPGIVLRYARELNLDEAQQQAIHEELEQSREKTAALQAGLQREVIAMGEVLKQNPVDEKQALAQLDKVLAAEREIKRAHLSLALAIRGKLTAEQQAKVREFQEKMIAQDHNANGGAPEAFRVKMQRLQEHLARAHQDGRDMSSVQPVMAEIQPLIHQGKFKEAEPLIDRALKIIEGEKK